MLQMQGDTCWGGRATSWSQAEIRTTISDFGVTFLYFRSFSFSCEISLKLKLFLIRMSLYLSVKKRKGQISATYTVNHRVEAQCDSFSFNFLQNKHRQVTISFWLRLLWCETFQGLTEKQQPILWHREVQVTLSEWMSAHTHTHANTHPHQPGHTHTHSFSVRSWYC